MILVRRKISGRGFPTGEEEVDVRGPLLQQALTDILCNVEGFSFDEEPPQIEPRMLFHAHDGLAALLKTKDPNAPEEKPFIFELEAALQYIREDFDTTFTSLSNLLPNRQITFAVLWSLFPPNTLIYGKDLLRNPRAWSVRSISEKEDKFGNRWVQIEPEHIDYNGTDLGSVESDSLRISAFQGAKNIHDLPYFPMQYHPDVATARQGLLDMGRKAMRLHGRRLVEYQGHALKEVPSPRDIAKFNVRVDHVSV